MTSIILSFFFFFNDTATTEIYTLSLHDALPIFRGIPRQRGSIAGQEQCRVWFGGVLLGAPGHVGLQDRKSTRLNSSHSQISYAVFCLKKKKRALPSHFSRDVSAFTDFRGYSCSR